MPPLAMRCLVAAISEALTNLERHSEVRSVSIAITWSAENVLRMTISDDGVGDDVATVTPKSEAMRMRAAFAEPGGLLPVNSVTSTGTTISAMATRRDLP
ncbi:hypothetical protein [Nonomuraea sp. NPDC050786]|uniref:hypothetical protein n=1 Tax=Nonomuraea sp. NPDC050786 TaxID=3154840 RepID=UPI0033C3E75C